MEQIEKKIAVCAYEIIEYRQAAVSKINTNLSLVSLPFNSCIIELNYEDTLKITSDMGEFTFNYENTLFKNRTIDKETNRTLVGPSKIEVKMWKLDDRSVEAKYCSTGEQKSILISIILSVAQIIKNSDFAKPPIILIDEAMAHLDQHHREALVDELSKLNTQSWYTGVSKEIFDHLSQDTIFFEVKNLFNQHGFMIIILAGFTPLPFKAFTITAGYMSIQLIPFIIASFIGRALRFFIVAAIFHYLGKSLADKLKKYFEYIGILITIMIVYIIYIKYFYKP